MEYPTYETGKQTSLTSYFSWNKTGSTEKVKMAFSQLSAMSYFLVFFSHKRFFSGGKVSILPLLSREAEAESKVHQPRNGAWIQLCLPTSEPWVVLILHLRTPSVHYLPGFFFLCNLFVSRAADREVRAPYKHVRSRFLPGWRAKHRRCNLSRSHPEFWVGRAPHAPCEILRVLLPPW